MPEEALCMKTWSIPSRLGQEKTIMQEVRSHLTVEAEQHTMIENIITSVSEACLNAIEHGNSYNEELPVKVEMLAYADRYQFRIYDYGIGFDSLFKSSEPRSPHYTEDPRGWGLLFIRTLSDGVSCGHADGCFYIELLFQRAVGRERTHG